MAYEKDARCDEKLVLDVHEVLRQLDRLEIRVLDRVLDAVRRAHTPRATAPTDLQLARSGQAKALELSRAELGWGQKGRHRS